MKRLSGLAFLVAVLLGTSGALAAGPQPLTMQDDFVQLQDPVENQSPEWDYASNGYNMWQCTHDGTFEEYLAGGGTTHADNCVHNPTRCIWDADDYYAKEGYGYLAAGATVTATLCIIADQHVDGGGYSGEDKTADVWVYSPAKTLTVRMTDSTGQTWLASPVPNGSGWDYIICYRRDEPGPFPEIPNSNGGHGLQFDYTLSITATKKTNAVVARFQVWGWLRRYQTTCENIYAPWM